MQEWLSAQSNISSLSAKLRAWLLGGTTTPNVRRLRRGSGEGKKRARGVIEGVKKGKGGSLRGSAGRWIPLVRLPESASSQAPTRVSRSGPLSSSFGSYVFIRRKNDEDYKGWLDEYFQTVHLLDLGWHNLHNLFSWMSFGGVVQIVMIQGHWGLLKYSTSLDSGQKALLPIHILHWISYHVQ